MPQPSETGRSSLPQLENIIKPTADLVPSLQQWTEAAGKKVGGTPTLIGFILDKDCIHSVVRIVAPSRGGIFALGGKECSDLFLISYVKNREGSFFSVNWGGTYGEQTYMITSSKITLRGFTLTEEGSLGLVQGDGSGKIPTNGVVLFPQDSEQQPLNGKLQGLFPYSDKKSCTSALWSGLQKAAGINK